MGRRGGDAYRASAARASASVLNNLPGAYPVEAWTCHYWALDEEQVPRENRVVLELPEGYSAAAPRVMLGEPGCVLRVRRWGVGCRPSLLEPAGFDPASVAGADATDQALIDVCFAATQFDLPGGFVIADIDYPLQLRDAEGVLRGSSVDGISLLGALSYLVSDGRVASDFQRVRREAPELYRVALAELRMGLAGA